MDKLSSILNVFSISAGVFYSGPLCGLSSFEDPGSQTGHLHLLRKGRLQVVEPGKAPLVFETPTLIYYPKPTPHYIKADDSIDTEVVCTEVHYGAGADNPLANSMPSIVHLSVPEGGRIQGAAEWLFEEAFSQQGARQLVMNRLSEILIIQLLRHVISSELVNGGMMAGLAHPKLSKALDALHNQPEKNWSLAEMAGISAMSRARFSSLFKEVVGQTPGDYLTGLRIEVAKGLLQQDRPVGWVANEVGYENASALARVFRSKTGLSPKEWQKDFLTGLKS